MHLAVGGRILATGAVPHADVFSATFGGRPWQAHEWLAEALMALVWRAGGWTGFCLLFAAAAGLTVGLLTRHIERWLRGTALAAVVLLSVGCLAASLLARPHLLALPLTEMWTAELVFARSEARVPSWKRLLPIMVVWANLHGSFIFGLFLLAAFGVEAMWARRREGMAALRPWVLLGAAAGLAAMISPYGVWNLVLPLRLNAMGTLSGIGEWAPMDVTRNLPFEAALLAGVFILVWKRVRVALLPLLLLLLVTDMSLHHVRHLMLFALVAPLVIAEPLGEALDGVASPRRWGLAPTGIGALAAALLAAARLAFPFSPANSPVAPEAALGHIPPDLRNQPVFNAYAFGGYLIFSGVRPYIDSRAELYGDDFRARYLRLQDDPVALAQELAARKIAWTLLEPGSPAAAFLDASPDWRRLYADRYAVAHVRAGATTR